MLIEVTMLSYLFSQFLILQPLQLKCCLYQRYTLHPHMRVNGRRYFLFLKAPYIWWKKPWHPISILGWIMKIESTFANPFSRYWPELMVRLFFYPLFTLHVWGFYQNCTSRVKLYSLTACCSLSLILIFYIRNSMIYITFFCRFGIWYACSANIYC